VLVPGLVGGDDFKELHLVDRREVVHSDDVLRPRAGLGDVADRQGRRVGRKYAVWPDVLLHLANMQNFRY